MEIPLRNRKGDILALAIIDEDDFEKVSQYKWYAYKKNDKYKYVLGTVNGKCIRMHQMVYKIYNNHISDLIDYSNKNKLDNRIANLIHKSKNTTSKYHKKWQSQICKDGKYYYYLRTFTNEVEAAEAYNKKAIELYGEYANLNVF